MRDLLEELAIACSSDPTNKDATFQYAFALSRSQQFSELRYAISMLDALVLSGPLLRPARPPSRAKKWAARILARIAPRTLFATNVEPKHLSRDARVGAGSNIGAGAISGQSLV